MAYANFNNNGYDYLTEGNYVLFSSDGMHDDLFNYAAMDISSLSKLLKEYVFRKMNIITFDLKHHTKNSDTIFQIIELIKSSHPYYCYEYKNVIIEAIGEYFNELLVYSIYNKRTISPELPLQKKWYFERFFALMPPFIHDDGGYYPEGLYPDDFFNKYRTWVDDKDFDTRECEDHFLAIPQKNPSGFSTEITTHKIVCDMLYFILDTAAEGLKDLTISQRIWFYGNLFYTNGTWNQTQITKQLTFISPIIYKENGNYRQEAEYKNKIYELFKPIYVLRSLGYEYEKISTLVPKSLNSVIDYVKRFGTSEICEKYEINCLRELLLQEIISMIQSDTKIRKCANCNRYFVTEKSNQKYCKRIFENTGKLCSEIGRSRSYQKKTENDPIHKLYNTAYQKHYSQVRDDIPDTKKAFEKWSNEASAKFQETKNAKITTEEFIKWLIETTPGLSPFNQP